MTCAWMSATLLAAQMPGTLSRRAVGLDLGADNMSAHPHLGRLKAERRHQLGVRLEQRRDDQRVQRHPGAVREPGPSASPSSDLTAATGPSATVIPRASNCDEKEPRRALTLSTRASVETAAGRAAELSWCCSCWASHL